MFVQEDTMALTNSWQSVLLCLDEKCGGRKRGLFADMSACIKVIAVTCLPPFVSIISGFTVAYFKDLPLSWIWLAQGVGLVGTSGYAYILVNIGCILVEIVSSFLLWINWTMVSIIFFAAITYDIFGPFMCLLH